MFGRLGEKKIIQMKFRKLLKETYLTFGVTVVDHVASFAPQP